MPIIYIFLSFYYSFYYIKFLFEVLKGTFYLEPGIFHSAEPLEPADVISLLNQHYRLGRGRHDAAMYESGREAHKIRFIHGVLPTRKVDHLDIGLTYIAYPGLTVAPIHGVIRLNWEAKSYH